MDGGIWVFSCTGCIKLKKKHWTLTAKNLLDKN